jgi:hypothetical protein
MADALGADVKKKNKRLSDEPPVFNAPDPA